MPSLSYEKKSKFVKIKFYFWCFVNKHVFLSKSHLLWHSCIPRGVLVFLNLCGNFTERQILLSLCSVDFHTFTLQLPIRTLHSVAPELQVFVSSLENCQDFSKPTTPLSLALLGGVIFANCRKIRANRL